MTAPCLGCADRHIGCHSQCEKYKDFVDQNAKERDENHRQKQAHLTANDCKFEGTKRMQRGGRK